MITLYHFFPYHGLPDPSPFCVKVHLYLRAAGIKFASKHGPQNLQKAPKGKLPFIDDGGTIVPDSNFIIPYLKEKYGDKLDAHLTVEQKAVAHAFTRMLDENLYWCMVKSRWIDDAMWNIVREEFFGRMPVPLKWIVPPLARREVRKTLWLHGLGRHSDEELLMVAKRDLQAVSDLLGGKDWFFGDRITTLDVVAFAYLAELIVPPHSNRLRDIAAGFPNLVRFVEYVKKQYYA
jgi:glutathione S-transferase